MSVVRMAGMRWWAAAAATLLWFSGGAPHALGNLAAQPPAEPTHLLIVAGIGGGPAYRDAFHETAMAMANAAVTRLGLPDSNVTVLTENPGRTPARIHGRSTREEIVRALARIATRAAPDDQVALMLIGHGSEQDGTARLNLPGPDLSAQDLARALAPFPGRSIAVVNLSSASGGFVEALAAPRRIVITATKSGFERNAPVFGQHFVDAFTGDRADADRNGRISLLEAFAYADREVARVYETDNRLRTEHARLGGDSALARRFFITGGRAVAAGNAGNPALAALHAKRDSLERALETLRGRKATMDSGAYERALESLLLEVARNGQAIRSAAAAP